MKTIFLKLQNASSAFCKKILLIRKHHLYPALIVIVVFLTAFLLLSALGLIQALSSTIGALAILVCLSTIVLLAVQLRFERRNMLDLAFFAQDLQSLQDSANLPGTPCEQVKKTLDRYCSILQNNIASNLLNRHMELDAWQHQINPHFLYNTLETIRSQALEDDSIQAAEMIEILGRILRYSLNRNSDMCTIDQELDCIRDYFRIQQYRFNDRFELQVHIDENDFFLRRYTLPRLTLQPLIENAISHGLDSKRSNGLIEVKIQRTNKRILIYVSDNGSGIQQERLIEINNLLCSFAYNQRLSSYKNQNFGLALQNINARIKLLYGYEYGITVQSALNIGTQIIINLPAEEKYEKRIIVASKD